MARNKIISDRLNTFFTNNKMTVGESIPVTGTWSKGDIVISTIQANGECGWICVEAGTPGRWEIFGAGGGGSLVTINASEIVNNSVTEVSLSGLGVSVSPSDKLLVHYNSTHLFEGVDFEIVEEGTKIRKLGGGVWNESNEPNTLFTFELLKTDKNTNNNINLTDCPSKSKIGNLNSLQTENKNDLVAAINEVFQSGNNAKQGLVDALVAKDIEASTSESWDILNSKVKSIKSQIIPPFMKNKVLVLSGPTVSGGDFIGTTGSSIGQIDNKVYFLGGVGLQSTTRSRLSTLDLETGIIQSETVQSFYGCYNANCQIGNTVYMTCGYTGTSTVEPDKGRYIIFDLVTKKYTQGDINLSYMGSNLIPCDSTYGVLFGGRDNSNIGFNSVFKVDFKTNTISQISNMPSGFKALYGKGVKYDDTKVAIFPHGSSSNGTCCELDIKTNTYTSVSTVTPYKASSLNGVIKNSMFISYSGAKLRGWDFNTKTFTDLSETGPVRYNSYIVEYGGIIYVIGGENKENTNAIANFEDSAQCKLKTIIYTVGDI